MTISSVKFCYAKGCNDHDAYPMSLVDAPPPGWHYKPTAVNIDPELGRPWVYFDVAPDEIIHASSLIPTNAIPWVLDTDHIEYLLLQAQYPFSLSRKQAPLDSLESAIIRAITSHFCIGVVAWSEAARHSIFALCERHSASPPRIVVAYPAIVPPSQSGFPLSASLRALQIDIRPDTVKFLLIDGQSGICKRTGRKNVQDGVRCIEHLRAKGYLVELIVVDSSEEVKETKYVHMLPRLSRAELWYLYRTTDILLFLSRQDSFGYVLMEAMYNGLCCVAATAPSIPSAIELIDEGRTGMTVRYLSEAAYPHLSQDIDMQQLLAICEKLVASKEVREKIAQQARGEFLPGKHFSIETRNSILLRGLL